MPSLFPNFRLSRFLAVEQEKQGGSQNRQQNKPVKVERTDDPHIGAQFIGNGSQACRSAGDTAEQGGIEVNGGQPCLLYTSPSPRDS